MKYETVQPDTIQGNPSEELLQEARELVIPDEVKQEAKRHLRSIIDHEVDVLDKAELIRRWEHECMEDKRYAIALAEIEHFPQLDLNGRVSYLESLGEQRHFTQEDIHKAQTLRVPKECYDFADTLKDLGSPETINFPREVLGSDLDPDLVEIALYEIRDPNHIAVSLRLKKLSQKND